MARKGHIVVGLVFLAIFLTSGVAAPLEAAKSSSPERLLFRVVKRTPKYLVARHSHPQLRLVLRHGQHEVTLRRAGNFRVASVTRKYVVLRAARLQAVKSLIVQPADLVAIRARVAAGTQPWAKALSILSSRVDGYLTSKPNPPATSPLRGPVDLDGALRPYMDRLTVDGAKMRDLSIAYAVSQKAAYLAKARQLLLAWVRRYSPTTYQNCAMPDTGQLQAYGSFSMAYGYDYIKNALTGSERVEARAWFAKMADAEQTTLKHEHDRLASTATRRPYDWSVGGVIDYYNPQDRLIGGDFAMLISGAVLACSYESEQRSGLIRAIYAPSNAFCVGEMVRRSTAPTNDGDYVSAHGVPVPMMMIFKTCVAGRGGTFDYGTYNVRLATALLEMGPAMRTIVPTADVVADHPSLAASWDYMARFFGPGQEPSPNPTDSIDLGACLNRFMIALHDVPSDRVRNAALSGSTSWYSESQWLGPVTLTHYPLP